MRIVGMVAAVALFAMPLQAQEPCLSCLAESGFLADCYWVLIDGKEHCVAIPGELCYAYGDDCNDYVMAVDGVKAGGLMTNLTVSLQQYAVVVSSEAAPVYEVLGATDGHALQVGTETITQRTCGGRIVSRQYSESALHRMRATSDRLELR
jgi:hypothetical protein